MQKKALLALVLVMTMLLSGCALIQKDTAVDMATVIVRVNDQEFTKADVQYQVVNQLAYTAYIYSMYGMNYDATDEANVAETQQAVVDMMIESAVIDQKAAAAGMNVFTEEEQAEIDAQVEETWQENYDSVLNAYFAETELEGEELEQAVTAKCEELGYSRAVLTEQYSLEKASEKLYNATVASITVTDEELQADYDAKVESAKSSFESSPSNYGYAVNNGTAVYYRPAGYRMVKQILVKFSDEDQALVDEASSAYNTAASEQITCHNTVTALGLDNVDALLAQVTVTLNPETGDVETSEAAFTAELTEDAAAAVKTLAEANARFTHFEAKLTEAEATAFANIDAEADAILADLEAGADWDTLMAEKTDDPGMQGDTITAKNGYAVCEDYIYFDDAFTAAAMGVAEVGQWSDKIPGAYGYYIIQYTSDVTEGPVALEEVSEDLTASLLSTKQSEHYEAQLQQWISEADVFTDMDALKN